MVKITYGGIVLKFGLSTNLICLTFLILVIIIIIIIIIQLNSCLFTCKLNSTEASYKVNNNNVGATLHAEPWPLLF
jgi:hypothetical protein